jgi:hypothetical protein
MSLIFTNTPTDFQPVLSDGLFFTASGNTYNPLTTFKFRYVYDLYVEGVKVFTGKCSPNPFGLGIIDLQQILETYCFNNPISKWNTTDIYTHTTFPFSRPYYDETISYFIRCGYEYSSTELGPITGFTGIGDTIGTPQYTSPSYKTFRSTMGVNGRATQQDFNIDPFVLSGSPSTINPTTSGLFLTNAPRIQDIGYNDYYTLGFTNYYMGGSLLSEGYYVKYTFYDDQGSEITGTTYENLTTNGGGPRTNCGQVYQSLFLIEPPSSTEFNTLYVGCGTENIPNFPPNCVQYTVQLFGHFTGTTTPIQPTPSPTPSPTSTPLTPTPTPTPSVTPGCVCSEYIVTNTGSTSATIYFVNCSNQQSQSFILISGSSTSICSCSTPFSENDIIVVNNGPCYVPPVTPSVTPSPSPCQCGEYEIVNEGSNSPVLFYTFCDGTPIVITLYPGYNELLCGCVGTFICSDPNVTITYAGPC